MGSGSSSSNSSNGNLQFPTLSQVKENITWQEAEFAIPAASTTSMSFAAADLNMCGASAPAAVTAKADEVAPWLSLLTQQQCTASISTALPVAPAAICVAGNSYVSMNPSIAMLPGGTGITSPCARQRSWPGNAAATIVKGIAEGIHHSPEVPIQLDNYGIPAPAGCSQGGANVTSDGNVVVLLQHCIMECGQRPVRPPTLQLHGAPPSGEPQGATCWDPASLIRPQQQAAMQQLFGSGGLSAAENLQNCNNSSMGMSTAQGIAADPGIMVSPSTQLMQQQQGHNARLIGLEAEIDKELCRLLQQREGLLARRAAAAAAAGAAGSSALQGIASPAALQVSHALAFDDSALGLHAASAGVGPGGLTTAPWAAPGYQQQDSLNSTAMATTSIPGDFCGTAADRSGGSTDSARLMIDAAAALQEPPSSAALTQVAVAQKLHQLQCIRGMQDDVQRQLLQLLPY
jgi:hypothetical protein